jgi:hypothetical protein
MPPPLLISKKRRFTTKHNTTTTTTKDPNYYQISSTLPSCQGKEKTQGEREREREIRKPTKPTTQKQNPNPVQEETVQDSTPAWVVEKMGPPSVESVTWEGGRGEYVLTAVSSSASSNFLQFA